MRTNQDVPVDMDVIIAGGGVIGLTLGWRLLKAGYRVTILDRAEAGRGASWAAAGMLAGASELGPEDTAALTLSGQSQALWPSFKAELEAISGSDVGYRDHGTVLVASHRDALNALHDAHRFYASHSLQAELLTPSQALEVEPALAPSILGALICKDDIQVDPRKLVSALRAVFLMTGGQLLEHRTVEKVLHADHRATGVVVDGAPLHADAVVLACGWETGSLLSGSFGAEALTPVKGQIVSLMTESPLLCHVLRSDDFYLVQRSDQEIVLGATSEKGVTDLALDERRLQSLFERASAVAPRLKETKIKDHWAGIRPGSVDGLPLIGPTDSEGLYVATGHYRNGIFWAPATAELILNYIDGDVAQAGASAFLPKRFAA